MIVSFFIKATKISVMSSPYFSLQEAKQRDMIVYFEKLGYKPQKVSATVDYLLTPRAQKVPSFLVKIKLYTWHNLANCESENHIYFGVLFYHYGILDLLKKLLDYLSFHQPQTLTVQQPQANPQKLPEALEPGIKIIAARPPTNPAICRYFDDRKTLFRLLKTIPKINF
jgi:hypothetical protein